MKKSHTVHIEIQQGKLIKGGLVDQNSTHWQEIKESSIVSNWRHKIDWFGRRRIFLDNITLSKSDRVITGLQFVTENNSNLGVYLKLQVQLTKFNYSTGLLLDSQTLWLSRSGYFR